MGKKLFMGSLLVGLLSGNVLAYRIWQDQKTLINVQLIDKAQQTMTNHQLANISVLLNALRLDMQQTLQAQPKPVGEVILPSSF